jgi:hypothetical protein
MRLCDTKAGLQRVVNSADSPNVELAALRQWLGSGGSKRSDVNTLNCYGMQDGHARAHSNAFRYVTSNCLYRKLWQKSFPRA